MYKIIPISSLIDLEKFKNNQSNLLIKNKDVISFLQNVIKINDYSIITEYPQYVKVFKKDDAPSKISIKIGTKKTFTPKIIHNYSSDCEDFFSVFSILVIFSIENDYSFNYKRIILYVNLHGSIEGLDIYGRHGVDNFYKSSDFKLIFSDTAFVLIRENNYV